MKITVCLAVGLTMGCIILVAMKANETSKFQQAAIRSYGEVNSSLDTEDTEFLKSMDSDDSLHESEAPISKKTNQYPDQIIVLEELNEIDVGIHKAQVEIETELVSEIKSLPKAEIILAEASYMLSELEQQGVEVTYDPVLLKSAVLTPDRVEVNQAIIEVEEQLIDIENKFRSLSDD